MRSAEQAIHERWETFKPLADLVSPRRVLTGWLPTSVADDAGIEWPTELPFVSLTRDGDSEVTRCSGGLQIEAVIMRFDIYSEDLDSGKKIADGIQRHFDRKDFPWRLGKVLDCKMQNHIEENLPNGSWHVSSEWLVRVTTQR